MIDSRIIKNRAAMSNTLSIFRKQGILKTEGYTESIADDFNYVITDKLLFSVMLDNT